MAKFGFNASGIIFWWRDNSSYKLYTLGPLCLWQCFFDAFPKYIQVISEPYFISKTAEFKKNAILCQFFTLLRFVEDFWRFFHLSSMPHNLLEAFGGFSPFLQFVRGLLELDRMYGGHLVPQHPPSILPLFDGANLTQLFRSRHAQSNSHFSHFLSSDRSSCTA